MLRIYLGDLPRNGPPKTTAKLDHQAFIRRLAAHLRHVWRVAPARGWNGGRRASVVGGQLVEPQLEHREDVHQRADVLVRAIAESR